MSDNEWDELLNTHAGPKPSEAQLSKWKSAALNAKIDFQKQKLNRKSNWTGMVAATVVGILIGASLTMSFQSNQSDWRSNRYQNG